MLCSIVYLNNKVNKAYDVQLSNFSGWQERLQLATYIAFSQLVYVHYRCKQWISVYNVWPLAAYGPVPQLKEASATLNMYYVHAKRKVFTNKINTITQYIWPCLQSSKSFLSLLLVLLLSWVSPHLEQSFSLCRKFSMGLRSGDSGAVIHQLILCKTKTPWV